MDVKSLINEYEIVLTSPTINKVSSLGPAKEQSTFILLRYAIKNILHYTPQEAVTRLTYDTLEKLKLMQYVDKYVKFLGGLNDYEDIVPVQIIEINGDTIKVKGHGKRKAETYTTKIHFEVGDFCLINDNKEVIRKIKVNNPDNVKKVRVRNLISEEESIRYLLSKCYPSIIKFDEGKYIIDIYKKVLNEKPSVNTSVKTSDGNTEDDADDGLPIPKRFFKEENNGRSCAVKCLIYVISRYLVPKVHNIEELYELFGKDPNAAKKMLKKYKLYKPLKDLYGMSPISYLHNALRPEQRNEFLFRYYKFKELYMQQVRLDKKIAAEENEKKKVI